MPVVKTSLSIRPEILEQIKLRGQEVSTIIGRDLERLYTLYSRALRQVNLTIKEASLLVDLLNGTLSDANSAASLHWEVDDGIRLDGLDSKWGIDGAEFIKKIASLSEIQKLALIDAAERFWQGHEGKEFNNWITECFMIKNNKS